MPLNNKGSSVRTPCCLSFQCWLERNFESPLKILACIYVTNISLPDNLTRYNVVYLEYP